MDEARDKGGDEKRKSLQTDITKVYQQPPGTQKGNAPAGTNPATTTNKSTSGNPAKEISSKYPKTGLPR
jgi:hypothetical protein